MDKLIETILKTFNQMGVTLVSISIESQPPEYYIQVDKSKLIYSLDETLKHVHDILWILTYGKLTDNNKHGKIKLNYEEVKGDFNENN